jgi:hypothetical protein
VTTHKLKLYALVAGIFVLGAGAGAGAGYAVAERRLADVLGEDRPEAHEARRFRALSRQLDLTDDQEVSLNGLLSRHREQNRKLARAMYDECGGELRQLRQRVDAEIRGLLNEEQKRRFDKLAHKRGKRFPLGGSGPGTGEPRRERDKDH